MAPLPRDPSRSSRRVVVLGALVARRRRRRATRDARRDSPARRRTPDPLAAPKSVSPLARHRRVDRGGPRTRRRVARRRRRGMRPSRPSRPPTPRATRRRPRRRAMRRRPRRLETTPIRDDSSSRSGARASRRRGRTRRRRSVGRARRGDDVRATSESSRSAVRGFRPGDALARIFHVREHGSTERVSLDARRAGALLRGEERRARRLRGGRGVGGVAAHVRSLVG